MPMCAVRRTAWIFIASATICGCGGISDEERLKALVPDAAKTTPVHGKVLVDGEPVESVWVKLHSDEVPPQPHLPKAQTAPDGTFKITTYIGGDGAPPGRYKITVEWLTFQPVGARWVGPSKGDDKYGNAKTSPFEVTVGSELVTLPTFEVEAKPEGGIKKVTEPPPKLKFKKKSR